MGCASSWLRCGVGVLLAGICCSAIQAQPPLVEILPAGKPTGEVVAQRGEQLPPDAAWQLARLRYHIYRYHEYPRMMRQLEAEIRLAEAELAALDRQIAEYESISRPVTSQPFMVTLESARLRRLSTHLRLAELRQIRQSRLQTFVTEQMLKQQEVLSQLQR